MMARAESPSTRDDYGLLRRVLYGVLWIVSRSFFALYFRLRVVDRPKPFPRGPLVVAANHCSFLDPVVLATSMPRRVTYLVTSSIYDLKLYRPWMWIFGCIRVEDDSVNVDALRRAIAVLERGGVIGIFPEGGISDDGRLKEGQIGVASLLLKGDAPVLTAGIVGTHEALPRNGGAPRPHRVEVRWSRQIETRALGANTPPREARRALRDQVMAAIAAVLPPHMASERSSA